MKTYTEKEVRLMIDVSCEIVAKIYKNVMENNVENRKKRIWANELFLQGGKWLGAARSWLQHRRTTKGVRGDMITWGDPNARFELGANSIEELAAEVAAAVMNEQEDKDAIILKQRGEIFDLQRQNSILKIKLGMGEP